MSPAIVLVIFVCSLLNIGLKPITYSAWRQNKVNKSDLTVLKKHSLMTKHNDWTVRLSNCYLTIVNSGSKSPAFLRKSSFHIP